MRSGTRRRANRLPDPKPPFRVAIELGSVMDYMTMLRGMTAIEGVYTDFTSEFFPRFPKFDGSDVTTLPEPFDDFFERAATEHGLFQRVRPYDYAHRDLTYLHRKGAQIVIYIPPEFEPYRDEINIWTQRYFPKRKNSERIETWCGEFQNFDAKANIWVTRNPDLTEHLIGQGQPLVVIDGNENSHIENVVRLIRWDQVGNVLRQAQEIDLIDKDPTRVHVDVSRFRFESIEPHLDVWDGYPLLAPLVEATDFWIAKQKAQIERVITNSSRFLTWDQSTSRNGEPFSEEEKDLAKRILRTDLETLRGKSQVVSQLSSSRIEMIREYTYWAETVLQREAAMHGPLTGIAHELGVNQVTGQPFKGARPSDPHLTNELPFSQLLQASSDTEPLTLGITAAEAFGLLAESDSTLWEDLAGNYPDQYVGLLSEFVFVAMLQKQGWKVLHKKPANGKDPSIEDCLGLEMELTKKSGTRVRQEIDCCAVSPEGEMFIFEVKAIPRPTSSAQKIAQLHFEDGGTAKIIGCPELEGKEISPNYRVINISSHAHNFAVEPSKVTQLPALGDR